MKFLKMLSLVASILLFLVTVHKQSMAMSTSANLTVQQFIKSTHFVHEISDSDYQVIVDSIKNKQAKINVKLSSGHTVHTRLNYVDGSWQLINEAHFIEQLTRHVG